MKASNKNKNIRTIPEGTWESGVIMDKKNYSKKQHLNDIATDIQGNGYPIINDDNQDKQHILITYFLCHFITLIPMPFPQPANYEPQALYIEHFTVIALYLTVQQLPS